jgi:erythritol transport system ATP-binding protein
MTDKSAEVVLRAVGITKHYGGVKALRGVDFAVRSGQVTVLFGENGAGKSTLMKIMAGVEKPTDGHLELRGERIAFETIDDAVEVGISIIHQELNLYPNLSVRDNIFVGRELRGRLGQIDYAREDKITRDLMARLEQDVEPTTLVRDLTIGQQQIVEIARALSTDASILIMDEPTSALSETEVEVLFSVINELTSRGVAIVYISHHLEEAISVADRAIVFRDGRLVAAEWADQIDLAWVVAKMVGRNVGRDFKGGPRRFGDVQLSIENLSVADPLGSSRLLVDDVSLQVRAGEVVCLYGLMGAGRTELMEALAGRMPVVGGRALLNGQDLTHLSVRARMEKGMGLVPEDRQRDGLIQLLSVGSNLSLSSIGSLVRRNLIDRAQEREKIDEMIESVRIRAAADDINTAIQLPVTSLSGGNQQKVVIGKVLMTAPTMLLLDEPTRGIDVGAKDEIFNVMFYLAAKGLAVLFVTSEINEAMAASHRLLVMSRGRLVAEFDPRTANRDDVVAATGGSPMAAA